MGCALCALRFHPVVPPGPSGETHLIEAQGPWPRAHSRLLQLCIWRRSRISYLFEILWRSRDIRGHIAVGPGRTDRRPHPNVRGDSRMRMTKLLLATAAASK